MLQYILYVGSIISELNFYVPGGEGLQCVNVIFIVKKCVTCGLVGWVSRLEEGVWAGGFWETRQLISNMRPDWSEVCIMQ